ncbi:4-hydroxy-tetrahydrodipicolinate synthase, partial [Mesorhizobium sp. B2-3-3]
SPPPRSAGVGSSDTRHTVRLAQEAEAAGADGLLVVTPYYSRPPQAAVEAHFLKVAEATGVGLMLYDIPGRTGTRIEPATLLRLAEHPRVLAVKDCSYDLLAATGVMARTSLAYYSGCEELNLPLYAIGGAGYVSTVANAVPRQMRAVLDAFDAGDTAEAARLNGLVAPLVEAMMAAGLPGTVTAKALLGAGTVREPLQPAGREAAAGLRGLYEELLAATA